MQLRRVIGIVWLATGAALLEPGCGGQTGEDVSGNQNTGGTWTANTSFGGSKVIGSTQGVGTGGAWAVPSSSPPSTGPLQTGGWISAGGAIGYTGGSHAGGSVVGGYCSSTNCGAHATGGVTALGGSWNAGGTYPTGGSHAGGTPTAGATFGGTPGTGGTMATDTSLNASNTCLLPADSGTCAALLTKYFFNVQTGQCETFSYGGCYGNANRFDTLQACQQRCDANSSLCPYPMPPTNEAIQCPLSAVCYYPTAAGCNCSMVNGNFLCVDLPCGDAGSADVTPDASVPPAALDAGMDVYHVRYWACACGSQGWSCAAY